MARKYMYLLLKTTSEGDGNKAIYNHEFVNYQTEDCKEPSLSHYSLHHRFCQNLLSTIVIL